MALALALGGCQSTTTSSSSPSISTKSATREEAFERQARPLWESYFKTYTRLLAQPSLALEDVRPYLSADEYAFIAQRIGAVREAGVRVQGQVGTRGFRVVDASKKTALVCVDNLDSRLIDKDGKDVTPASRKGDSTLRLVFKVEGGKLVLDRDETWSKSSAC